MSSECIQWWGRIRDDGYGTLGVHMAHRRVYEDEVGPIPVGLELDHLCGNRACVNVEHLEPVTRHENIARSEAGKPNREKTHCPRGHAYTKSNTGHSAGNRRYCRTCKTEKSRIYRAAKV